MKYILVFIAGIFVGFILNCIVMIDDFRDGGVISLDEIIITKRFKNHPPNAEKMNMKMKYLLKYCNYENPIVINSKNELIDGYTTYLLAKDIDIPPTIIKKG